MHAHMHAHIQHWMQIIKTRSKMAKEMRIMLEHKTAFWRFQRKVRYSFSPPAHDLARCMLARIRVAFQMLDWTYKRSSARRKGSGGRRRRRRGRRRRMRKKRR